jgi:UDP-N-acetylmuramoylalanine--D-glutamate ligase
MPNFTEFVKGKRITVLGLGLLGRGVGDAEFLAQCGATVLVTDKKSEAELAPSVKRLNKYRNVSFKLGGHDTKDFTDCDMVLKAAGVRLDSPEIAAARAAHVPVMMSTALFAKYAAEAGVHTVGVTGTRGKSTISHMVYHALKRVGKPAHLGGNIRGLSTLAMLKDVKKGDIAVLELDSWQLQGFGELQMSPHIAVFSNLMPDHQNYYYSAEEYFQDKANIFRFQKTGDTLIVGRKVESKIRAARLPVEPMVAGPLPADWMLRIPGEHNRENASLASAALLALGLNTREIKDGLESFEAVEGRLQLIGEKSGVTIYNDNNATTPEATIAALRALYDGKKHVILIAGGSDKGLELSELAGEIERVCKKVILLSGTGTDKLKQLLPDAKVVGSLPKAAEAAFAASAAGDTILFSPAFASFGMFKNEYERNDEFLKLVRSIKE